MTHSNFLVVTDAAALKVKTLIDEQGNPEVKLRVYTTGSGSSGIQYGFAFDETVLDGDTEIEKLGVRVLIDSISYQYLIGAVIDYTEGREGSKFVVHNPNDDEPPPAVSNALAYG